MFNDLNGDSSITSASNLAGAIALDHEARLSAR